MIPDKRVPPHPGEILLEEFLKPAKVTHEDFARYIGISPGHFSSVLSGRHRMSAELQWKVGQATGTTPDMWANLQADYELTKARPRKKLPVYPAFKT